MKPERPVYFISDAHIGRHYGELEARKKRLLLELFDRVRQERAHLIINGDLFDFWFDYQTVIPRKCFWLCHALNILTDAGIQIQMIPGNHDFWMSHFFQEEMGIAVHHQPIGLTLQGRRVFIAHGDGMAANDTRYRAMRQIIRHPLAIGLYRWVHPDFGIWVADTFSHRGGKKHSLRNRRIKPTDYHAVAQDYLRQGFDVVIFGHTHQPELVQFAEGVYLNIGNWIEDFSYGVMRDGEIRLEYWAMNNGYG